MGAFGELIHYDTSGAKAVLLAVGVDNLFDKTYAEHLSKTGSTVTGYDVPTNERINEPGRNVWAKLTISF